MEQEAVLFQLLMYVAAGTGLALVAIFLLYIGGDYVLRQFPNKNVRCWYKRQCHSVWEPYSFTVAPLFHNYKFKNWDYLKDWANNPDNRDLYEVEINECKQITNITKK